MSKSCMYNFTQFKSDTCRAKATPKHENRKCRRDINPQNSDGTDGYYASETWAPLARRHGKYVVKLSSEHIKYIYKCFKENHREEIVAFFKMTNVDEIKLRITRRCVTEQGHDMPLRYGMNIRCRNMQC